MSAPTLRELALETSLRERDVQVTELVDEVKNLRKYLNAQSAPSRSEPVTLPSTLLALLQPLIAGQSASGSAASNSNTITTGLLQRTRVLQEENDELYELLRTSETGKLKEEVRTLKRVTSRLQQALTDSHSVISSLSKELEATQLELTARQASKTVSRQDSTTPPRTSPHPTHGGSNNNSNSRPIPTGPRAFKKPRLSETRPSPPRTSVPPPVASVQGNAHYQGSSMRNTRQDRSPRDSRMDVEEERRDRVKRQPSPDRPREKNRERVRDRERERDRDKDRGRERPREKEHEREREAEKPRDKDRDRSRRGASGNGRGGGNARKNAKGHASPETDRSLAQRMGL